MTMKGAEWRYPACEIVLSKFQVLRLGVLHWCEKNETEDRLITVAAHEKYNRCYGAKTQRA